MTPLEQARHDRGWTRSQLLAALHEAARRRGLRVARRASLERQVKFFEKGERRPGDFYRELFCEVYGCTPMDLGFLDVPSELGETTPDLATAIELESRLAVASRVDEGLVELFEAQTQNFRLLDRSLGAGQLSVQTQAQVQHMEDMLRHAVFNGHRPAFASALTEAAALAGWQALDLGRVDEAWRQHEIGKSAAREAEDPIVFAHVTAQQAYVLLDLNRPAEAHTLIQRAHERDASRLPALLRSWLYAAEGEALAALGDEGRCRDALDQAAKTLPTDSTYPELPFLVLNETHLARWRGHCLARLGSSEAIHDLSTALESMDKSFTRAEAGLRCDLALALQVAGDRDQVRQQAERAAVLAATTSSARQRRRIASLLSAA